MGWATSAIVGLMILAVMGVAFRVAHLRWFTNSRPVLPAPAPGPAMRARATRRQAKVQVRLAGPAAANDSQIVTHEDIHEIESRLAGARIAVDDLWFAAADAASEEPMMTRAHWQADVHRRGYQVLQHLRAAEEDLERLRNRIRPR